MRTHQINTSIRNLPDILDNRFTHFFTLKSDIAKPGDIISFRLYLPEKFISEHSNLRYTNISFILTVKDITEHTDSQYNIISVTYHF